MISDPRGRYHEALSLRIGLVSSYARRRRGDGKALVAMRMYRQALPMVALAAAVLSGTYRPRCALAEPDKPEKEIAVPVVMEAATVRGKVIMLEDRRTDRQVLKDLKVAVWSTKKDEESGKPTAEPDKLLHETTTDEFGMFNLPELPEGNYVLIISELKIDLTVIPKAEERADQKEPKVLLILLPKEVVES